VISLDGAIAFIPETLVRPRSAAPDWEAALKGTGAVSLKARWRVMKNRSRLGDTARSIRATTERLSGGFISLSGGREGDPIYLERAWIRCTRVFRELAGKRGEKAQNYPTLRGRHAVREIDAFPSRRFRFSFVKGFNAFFFSFITRSYLSYASIISRASRNLAIIRRSAG